MLLLSVPEKFSSINKEGQIKAGSIHNQELIDWLPYPFLYLFSLFAKS